jgi:hypothetical protein
MYFEGLLHKFSTYMMKKYHSLQLSFACAGWSGPLEIFYVWLLNMQTVDSVKRLFVGKQHAFKKR